MSKCGKGCMPECKYFTTGGCISPFNCLYKIETGYINTAMSIPTYMEQYNGMSDDVIKRLKAENADLHERLKEAEHRAEVMERALSWLCDTAMRNVLVMAFPSTKTQVWNKQELYDYCIAQAEKKIVEEQK